MADHVGVCPRCLGRTFIVAHKGYRTIKPDWWQPHRHGVHIPLVGDATIGFCVDTRCGHSQVELESNVIDAASRFRRESTDRQELARQPTIDPVGESVGHEPGRVPSAGSRMVRAAASGLRRLRGKRVP